METTRPDQPSFLGAFDLRKFDLLHPAGPARLFNIGHDAGCDFRPRWASLSSQSLVACVGLPHGALGEKAGDVGSEFETVVT